LKDLVIFRGIKQTGLEGVSWRYVAVYQGAKHFLFQTES
jgi:hypothetical protein